MRIFACALSSFLLLLGVPPGAGAAGTIAGRLESVSILTAGLGASLAVRTSAIAALVATTAADAQTVVIELVGIAGRRRDLSLAGSPGMISHIAIDAVSLSESGAVTRVRVSLGGPSRHRMRISGNLVYIDFERIESGAPPVRLAGTGPTSVARPPLLVSDAKSPQRAAPTPNASTVGAAPSGVHMGAEARPMAEPPAESNALSRWSAIVAPLRHAISPPPAATVLARSWIPLVLNDGTTIFSHGDYAEGNEQLTFLLPFEDSDVPRVEAVSLPRSEVDLEATTRTAESVRAARYALALGPREFDALNEEVSAALDTVASEADPVARVRVVEAARRRLLEWPAAHHGYRARDIHDAVGMLDPILGQLRAAAGLNSVEVTLRTPAYAPPLAIAFRQPTLVDLLENAMRSVALLVLPAERTAVLRATAESLTRHRAALPADWFVARQRHVTAALDSETRVDAAYRRLTVGLIARAERAEREGNVRAVTALQSELMERDRELGQQRQDVFSSTMVALQAHFEAAAQAQLLRDQRELDAEVVRAYVRAVEPALKRFDAVQRDLQQVSRMTAAPSTIDDLREAIEFVRRTFVGQLPPPQVEEAHRVVLTAAQLVGEAIQEPVDPGAVGRSLEAFERGRRAIDASMRR